MSYLLQENQRLRAALVQKESTNAALYSDNVSLKTRLTFLRARIHNKHEELCELQKAMDKLIHRSDKERQKVPHLHATCIMSSI